MHPCPTPPAVQAPTMAKRYFGAVVSGAVVTFGLLTLMSAVVASPHAIVEERVEGDLAALAEAIADQDVRVTDLLPAPPPPPVDLPDEPPEIVPTPCCHTPARSPIRVRGYVVLSFLVTETGRVRDPVVLYSEPPGVFDRRAVAAALEFQYKPGTVGGVPVPVSGVRHKIEFVW